MCVCVCVCVFVSLRRQDSVGFAPPPAHTCCGSSVHAMEWVFVYSFTHVCADGSCVPTQETGAYVYSVRIGNNEVEDQFNGFFKNVNDQVSMVCRALKEDPQLAGGFNALGFSQGGSFNGNSHCPNSLGSPVLRASHSPCSLSSLLVCAAS